MKSIRFYAERAILDLPEHSKVIGRYPDLEWIDDVRSFRRANMQREKECVIFARKRGAWLKPFHCYDNNAYRYLSLDVAEGCLFDCVYCYLQSYLNHGALVLFVDTTNLLRELRHQSEGNLWISTGLLSDSLLAESYFPILPEISKSIPPNSVLEVRSKSGDLSCLRSPEIERHSVVVAWSLNPDCIVRGYEYGTAALRQRLNAAREAVALGYRVAFHFDPVFYFSGWKKAYEQLFHELEAVPSAGIAFLSVGLFRYMPELGTIIRKRFPFHPVLAGEFFRDKDGKYHYLRLLRKEMYQEFSAWLQPWKELVPIFRSMEPDARLLVL